MASIGIYPGTFDMVHDGHVAFAKAAISSCKLDSVIFMPEPEPRNKSPHHSLDVRLNALRLAAENDSTLHVIQASANRFTYTSLMPEIEQYMAERPTLLIGSDVALSLPLWEDLPKVISSFDIAVGVRSSTSEADVKDVLDKLGHNNRQLHYTFVHTQMGHLSSSTTRSK